MGGKSSGEVGSLWQRWAYPNIKHGMDIQNLMAELIQKYQKVYSSRQVVMKKVRKAEKSAWFEVVTKQHNICLYDARHLKRNCFPQKMLGDHTKVETWNSLGPWYYISPQAKAVEIAYARRQYEYYKQWPEHQPDVAAVEAIQVSPYYKEIRAYDKLKKKEKALSTEKTSLREAIRQLNKMKLGVKVEFGELAFYACDRITAVMVGEQRMKPIEFLELVKFESAMFGA